MPAAITDLMSRVTDSTTGRPVIAQLAAPGKAIGAASININDATNWTTATAIHISIYNTTTVGGVTVKDPTTQTDWKGVLTGTTINSLTITGGTDREYTAGAIVEITPTARYAKDLYEILSGILNQDGSLKSSPVQTALGLGASSLNGWNALGYTPSTITANGNRSFDTVFSGVDLTSILSVGMRLRHTRTVPAQTQCTSLNGTTQYWVKTSPNKLTFTDDFVVSAWVKLSSYSATNMTIASRYNGTSGWTLVLAGNTGQVYLQGFNAGSGNTRNVSSYQQIPLNKWVHITAQLDMSAHAVGATNSYIMIDGVDVPAQVAQAGTNPTALIQAGNLEIGSQNGGTLTFPGKIAQVAIFNAKVTQATMRTYYTQGLAGTETSLASAYSFNNSTADLNTTTPNDLSAGAGSPTATNADGPVSQDASGVVGSYDFTIITKITYSVGNTTVTQQAPEGNALPVSGGISSVAYSSNKAPFGMTVDEFRWEISAYVSSAPNPGTGSGTWYAMNVQLNVPVGSFKVGYSTKMRIAGQTSGSTFIAGFAQLSTVSAGSGTGEETKNWRAELAQDFFATGTPNITMNGSLNREAKVNLAAATVYYLNFMQQIGAGTILASNGGYSFSSVYAVPAYL